MAGLCGGLMGSSRSTNIDSSKGLSLTLADVLCLHNFIANPSEVSRMPFESAQHRPLKPVLHSYKWKG